MSPRKRHHQKKNEDEYRHIDSLPTRDVILQTLDRYGAPCGLGVLAEQLEVTDKPALNALRRRLNAMIRDGQVVRTRGSRFGLADRMELMTGHVVAHPDGFAFVCPEKGADDVYLPPREVRRVLHGDRVLIRVAGRDRRGRPYGNLVEVLEHANKEIIGRYHQEGGIGFVIPDNRRLNQRVLIPQDGIGSARDGQVVVAAIKQQPTDHTQPIGRIVEVLGEHMAPGVEIEIAVRSHGLPNVWPTEVLVEAQRQQSHVNEDDCARRQDLRELPLVTIDGQDARDFDDAVCARRTPKGFVLYVAISDVSHYVQPGAAIDREAFNRGTSVYFPDRVIPMLPEKLSNGICSLKPKVDRLSLVCELSIADDGKVRQTKFYEAVIRSHARLVYEDVDRWLSGHANSQLEKNMGVAESLKCLHALYHCLRKRSVARGALAIDTVEPRFKYDGRGKIDSIQATRRLDAHRLIEECMITANVAAAGFLTRRRCAALYRVHDVPDEDKVQDLGQFLHALGISFPKDKQPSPKVFARVLRLAATRSDKRLIDSVLLRSMKLAVYSEENAGHFGLALPTYTHFTSPIRRYPDLVVHRAIKAALSGVDSKARAEERMTELAGHCSMVERRADEATRDAITWLKCEFMRDKIGENFSGVISGVAEFGLFVELDLIFVEGLVHVTMLPPDYYHYDAIHHELTGRASGSSFRIGQQLEVILQRVDLDERKIDFALSRDDAPKKKSKARGRRFR